MTQVLSLQHEESTGGSDHGNKALTDGHDTRRAGEHRCRRCRGSDWAGGNGSGGSSRAGGWGRAVTNYWEWGRHRRGGNGGGGGR